MSEELDAVHLSAIVERLEQLLESTCQSLEDQKKLDLLPDNAFDWWESLKQKRRAYAEKMAARRGDLLASARSKLTPEEWEALKEE